MEIRPTMASMPNDGDVLKALRIQIVALLCILPNIFNKYNKGTLL